VVAASDARGHDLVDVTVSFDGKKLTSKLSGMAINVNPGQHTLRFEHDGDGPIEKKVLIREGEKARVIKVQFEPSKTAVIPPKPTSDDGALGASGSSKTLAYILGGVGVVGLGSFAYFGLTGSSQRSDLLGRCKGGACNLPQDQIDSRRSSVKTKFLVADISLGVGIVSLGVATYLFLKPDHKQEVRKDGARLHFDMALTERGSYASLSGSF